MADDTTAQAPARGLRLVVLAGFVGFTLTFAVFHFILPARLWESSASESSVSLFLCAVVAVLTAAVAAFLLSRNLRLENQRMRSAINNMSQGLCMFDGNERLVVCNRRYMQMYGLSADIVTPGSTLHSLLEYRTRNGTFSRDPVAYRLELTDAMAAGNTRSTEVKSKDNRTIAVINRPMPGCGWVATHEDITDVATPSVNEFRCRSSKNDARCARKSKVFCRASRPDQTKSSSNKQRGEAVANFIGRHLRASNRSVTNFNIMKTRSS